MDKYDRLKQRLNEDNISEIFEEMAKCGMGMIHGHKILREKFGWPMADCKKRAFGDPAWSEDHKVVNKLHDEFEEACNEQEEKEAPDSAGA